MNQRAPIVAQNASTVVLIPIGGLVGGLIIGGLRARFFYVDEIARLACILKWSVIGFFAGLALVVLLAVRPRSPKQGSVRQMMFVVVVVAVFAWFFTRVLAAVIGFEGF